MGTRRAAPAGLPPARPPVSRDEWPLPLGTRIRQIHGGTIMHEGTDRERQLSPDGTVIAYNVTDGWVSILHDDYVHRPSDRYGEFLARDLLRYHRVLAADPAPFTDDEWELLAQHLTLTQIDELAAALATLNGAQS